MQVIYRVPVDDWWNIHLNSYLLLQDFILNFFILYVYTVISLSESLSYCLCLKLALTENYLQEGEKAAACIE